MQSLQSSSPSQLCFLVASKFHAEEVRELANQDTLVAWRENMSREKNERMRQNEMYPKYSKPTAHRSHHSKHTTRVLNDETKTTQNQSQLQTADDTSASSCNNQSLIKQNNDVHQSDNEPLAIF